MTNTKSKFRVGAVLREAFQIYEDRIGILAITALFVFSVAVIGVALILSTGRGFLQAIGTDVVTRGSVWWYSGMVALLVARVREGRTDTSLSELAGGALRWVLTLILATVVIGVVIWAMSIAAIFVMLTISPLLGVIVLFAIVAYWLTRWALVAPAAVIERKHTLDALKRSSYLVERYKLEVFALVVFTAIAAGAVLLVLNLVGAAAGGAPGAVLGMIVGSVLAAPMLSLVISVTFFELREIKSTVASDWRMHPLAKQEPSPGATPSPGIAPAPGLPGVDSSRSVPPPSISPPTPGT